ncbi:MAG TPA: DUF1810 domain-containing protein [Rhizomicrobium sp.]|nr:DUF1810 domain-containing protein [Rhizomicrobium sp.]
MNEKFDLGRFVTAQEPLIGRALQELWRGRKQTHWMWFVFPQIAGLGFSTMSHRYAISGLEEARAYLDHSILGPRLRECTQAVLDVKGRSAHDIFGPPDDMKFHSSMTLFSEAAPSESLFASALKKYFDGEEDAPTLTTLS